MRRLKSFIPIILLVVYIFTFPYGCGPTVVVKKPPPPKTEVRPAKPWSNAVWISGHWSWRGGRYVWVSGHWAKHKLGKSWVAGHWAKRGRGWVWVKGHWR